MGGDKSGLLVEPTRTNAAAGAQWKALPRACTRPYRVVVRRKNVSKMKGEHMLVEGIRIFRGGPSAHQQHAPIHGLLTHLQAVYVHPGGHRPALLIAGVPGQAVFAGLARVGGQ